MRRIEICYACTPASDQAIPRMRASAAGEKKEPKAQQTYWETSVFFFTNQEIGLKYNHISLSAEKRRF